MRDGDFGTEPGDYIIVGFTSHVGGTMRAFSVDGKDVSTFRYIPCYPVVRESRSGSSAGGA
jgi:hypothetical protein